MSTLNWTYYVCISKGFKKNIALFLDMFGIFIKDIY